MEWISVSSLILIGLLLIVVELVFVPGTTLVGALGLILTAAGIWLGYANFGTPTGHIILAVSVLVGVVAVFVSLRSNAWERFALKNRLEGRVNEDSPLILEDGEEGTTISALRPSGTALFHEKHVEVRTKGEFVPAGATIRVIKTIQNKIIVEQVIS
ncbi:MAG: NfeD family protein [Hymenobacteraceae bacterium]|nr:NfeD family protein [Hymenobacteraceae bacterium]MDX5397232.1 NfeD family protein [Hymenobacteraceae bacterium]MDX5443115.1 NfeD family protein [Hymenobacteraceae bacterium]MDX5513308.1 NfeD family protein [Hymenobacteraceae bacterium]